MGIAFASVLLLLTASNWFDQVPQSTTDEPAAEDKMDSSNAVEYDAALARELGADDYGMKSYVLVILKTGEAQIGDEAQRQELFRGHFANMKRLAAEGKLVLAGPIVDEPPKRGIFIFDVKTIEEAEALVNTDPTVKAGVFKVEMSKYYGSAALMQVGRIHKTIQKKSIE